MASSPLFRISFLCKDSIYEVYARQVGESDMFGFLEVEEFVFGKTTALVVDPSEEKLKTEFSDVKRTYIPMHSVIRIDEVNKEGTGKITEGPKNNVSHFPGRMPTRHKDESR